MPGEPVRWQERAEPRLRRPGVVFVALAELAVVLLVLWLGFLRGGTSVPAGTRLFIVVLIVFVLARSVGSARRRSLPTWYVVTDRRAAEFRATGLLVAQARIQTPDLWVRRGPDGLSGSLDWGPSDPLSPDVTAPTMQSALARAFGPRVSATGLSPGRSLVFEGVADLDACLAVVRRARAEWRVATPDPSSDRSHQRPSVELGFLDTEAAGLINAVVLGVGSIALSVGAVLVVLSAIPGTRPFSFAPVVALFLLVFPLHVWTVVLAIGRFQRPGQSFLQRRRPGRAGRGVPFPFDNLPRWVTGTGIVVLLACGISIASVFLGHDLPGQPSYDPVTHTYTADDHGTEIPLTKSAYERAVKTQNRLFLSFIIVFTAASVGATTDETLRRRRSPYVHPRGSSLSP